MFKKPSPCTRGVKLDARFERIDVNWVKEASSAGELFMESMMESEKRLKQNDITVRRDSSRYTHSTVFFQSKDYTVKIGNSSLYGVFAAQQFVRRFQHLFFYSVKTTFENINLFIRYGVKAEQASCILNRIPVKEAGIYNECPFYPDCDQEMVASPYRTITGVCNNVHPAGHVPWGVPNTAYQRALAPDYADGITESRKSND